MISALEAPQYFEMYEKAAHQLSYGGPGHYGSLLGVLGALRQNSDMDSGLGYRLQRPRDFSDEEFRARVSEWNLDFTLPVQIYVIGGEQQTMTVEDFVGALVMHVDPEKVEQENIGKSHVGALSAAIRVEYETYWLNDRERKVAAAAKAHTDKRGNAVEDQAFVDLAVDTTLRKAKVEELKRAMRDHARDAHKIARFFPGTANELMRDRALRALTRPEHEFGQYALTQEDASDILAGLRRNA